MTYRVRNIVIALVFAIVAVTITMSYATSYKSNVDSQNKPVRVLVAARDIPVGTPAANLVSGGYVTATKVSKSALVPDAVRTMAKVKGLSVHEQINQGEQLTTRRFSSSSATGIQTQLSGKLRAIELGGDPTQLLAGTLQTGDHVDVLGSLALPEGGQKHFTRIIAKNLLVLQAPSKPGGGIGSSSASSTVILRMTDLQAQAVFHTVKYGQWSLALEPVTKPRSSSDGIQSNRTVLTEHGRETSLLHK